MLFQLRHVLLIALLVFAGGCSLPGEPLPCAIPDRHPECASELAGRMNERQIPGVSVAIIDDFEIIAAWAQGVQDAQTRAPLTTETLFQAASISKPVAAAGALRLVQEGRLSLDEDVNAYLVRWAVPENEYARVEKVTIRRILTHSAGFSISGSRGYAEGEPVPTLLEILNGEGPANSDPVRVLAEPGEECRYSGGGYTVLQQLIADVTDKPFEAFMQSNVLSPAGMRRSFFAPPTKEARKAVAKGHRPGGDVIPGGWHTYPERAAAGLWATPSDLARFAVSIMRAEQGEGDQVLSPEMAKAMTRRAACGWGLGPEVEGRGGARRFMHDGVNDGYRAYLVAYPETGQGAAVMVNSDNGEALIEEIVAGISETYNWPDS